MVGTLSSVNIVILLTVLLHFMLVTSTCPTGCDSCNGNGNGAQCDLCNERYRLENGNCIACPVSCLTCTNLGKCEVCEVGFWNKTNNCRSKCPDNCLAGCEEQNGNCYVCKAGYYGVTCNYSCEHCLQYSCSTTNCLQCEEGYTRIVVANVGICQPKCPANCSLCYNASYCEKCDDGFYSNGNHCVPCSISMPCNSCNNLPNCLHCRLTNGILVCDSCEAGYSLDNGKCFEKPICSAYCRNGCSVSGACIDGCLNGYSGTFCNFKCKESCLNCSWFDQNVCEACKDDFYKENCNITCSPNCLPGQRKCRFIDGYCLNGCKTGYWGTQCEIECDTSCIRDNTTLRVCDRNGTCVRQCSASMEGGICPETTTATNKTQTKTEQVKDKSADQTEDKKEPVAAIGGGVGGGLLVCIVVTGVVIFITRMRRQRIEKKEMDQIQELEAELPNVSTDLDNRYANAIKQSSAQLQDYMYAVPYKPKKSQNNVDGPDTTSNSSSAETVLDFDKTTYNTIADTELDPDEDINTAEDVKLEDIDDGDAIKVQPENESPTSDTYYNTSGLVRSRIQVSNLLQYIQNKTDFDSEFENLPQGLTRPCKEALKPFNRKRNRYNGVYAYDATRVDLGSKEYINACIIEGEVDTKAYIASLGPTKITMQNFATFWEMVWQENTQKIVMLTNLVENEKVKCEQYWPDVQSARMYGNVSVTCKSESTCAEFIVRELVTTSMRQTRTVTQYHYTAWPDKAVPDTVVSLLEFRNAVEQNQKDAGPVVVHCSAGIGRTGTYIALDILIRQGKAENFVDIFGCVSALRGQRANMVQNLEQYTFLHHCVVYALTCDTEPVKAVVLDSMTNEKVQEQFQSYSNLPALSDKDVSATTANKKRKENRKDADIPEDRYRVKLKLGKKDYMNAVYVDGYIRPNQYIVAQTPMPNTVEDFVSMLYQEKVKCIVCLDDENVTDKTVAHYIPPENKVLKFGRYQLYSLKSEEHDAFCLKEFKMEAIGNPSSGHIILKHYKFKGWMLEALVPENMVNFLHLITSVNKQKGTMTGQVLVHCLDGAKRSGLFCAVSNMLEKLSLNKELSVINTIGLVQARRRTALQTFDQFRFCYSCVKEYIETAESKSYYNIL